MTTKNNPATGPVNLALPDQCCTATTGCDWDGTLRRVRTEPIYTQKVYDAKLFNLQALRTVTNFPFTPALGRGARIKRVLAIRCRKFFNPQNVNDPANLIARPDTKISGAEFVEDGCGKPITVIGADGKPSQRILYADTTDCDARGRGTPIFGTQTIEITGNVIVEIDVIFTDHCDKECKATLSANIPIADPKSPLLLTNFFELCLPSVFEGAFLPRFTEFCNISCEARLATNNIARDLIVNPATGAVRANLIIALCVTCEKKIIVPVQLCVLSTGFPVLAADVAPICTTFPSLFPPQIDEVAKKPCPPRRGCAVEDLEAAGEPEPKIE